MEAITGIETENTTSQFLENITPRIQVDTTIGRVYLNVDVIL